MPTEDLTSMPFTESKIRFTRKGSKVISKLKMPSVLQTVELQQRFLGFVLFVLGGAVVT